MVIPRNVQIKIGDIETLTQWNVSQKENTIISKKVNQ